jgi:hypothetical protein
MNQITAKQLANNWMSAWNKHDINKLAEFYDEDCELSSPLVAELTRRSSNELKGLRNIRWYWEKLFAAMPDVSLEIISVLSGLNSIVITHIGPYNTLSAVVFYFNKNNKIIKSTAFVEVALSSS